MTDKVQKIREEVERLKSQLLRGACSSQIAMETRCKEEAYNEVLSIIDSLQEEPEPQFKVGDTIRSKHWNTAVHKIISMDDKSYCLDNGGKVDLPSQQLWELVEEPVSEQNLSNVERIGKDWKEEPISDDLEEACEQLSEDARKHKAETSSPFFSQTDYKQGVMDGAKWQKEQIEEVLLSEVLPCFMHGGEADEVVAKLDEVLNQKK